MNRRLPARELEVKYVGQAVECGTLTILLEALILQPVMVMPLERTFQHGSLTVHQWMIHVTTRTVAHRPLYYASMVAAEVMQGAIGLTLTVPPQQLQREAHPIQHAQQLQRQLQDCIVHRLKCSPKVSQVIVPARLRLPDEWIWSARCIDERIQYRDGSWMLLEP